MHFYFKGRWCRDYNPDLCFIPSNTNGQPIHATRQVMMEFPHSQHRPVIVEVGIQIPMIHSIPKPRWNFSKAAWQKFSNNLDVCVRFIPPTAENYDRFVGATITAAKKHIPRGYRKEYLPGWNEESEKLYQQFEDSGDPESADDLLRSLDANRQQKWTSIMENMDFTKSSRKAWSQIRKLGTGEKKFADKSNIDPNLIADRIVNVSRVESHKEHSKTIMLNLKHLKRNSPTSSEYSRRFTTDDIKTSLLDLKPGFLKNCGENTRRWLARFYSNIITECFQKNENHCIIET